MCSPTFDLFIQNELHSVKFNVPFEIPLPEKNLNFQQIAKTVSRCDRPELKSSSSAWANRKLPHPAWVTQTFNLNLHSSTSLGINSKLIQHCYNDISSPLSLRRSVAAPDWNSSHMSTFPTKETDYKLHWVKFSLSEQILWFCDTSLLCERQVKNVILLFVHFNRSFFQSDLCGTLWPVFAVLISAHLTQLIYILPWKVLYIKWDRCVKKI